MKKISVFTNRLALVLMSCCFVIIAALSSVACWFSYQQRKEELLSALDLTLSRTVHEYRVLTDNFWNIYMPVFRQESIYDALRNYFNGSGELAVYETMNLTTQLGNLVTGNDYVRWVALISDNRDTNYIYYAPQSSLRQIGTDFPYWSDIENRQSMMEIYGLKTVKADNESYDCIAIAGGLPKGMMGGTIVVGFMADNLQQTSMVGSEFGTLQYNIISEDQLIYSSAQFPYIPENLPDKGSTARVRTDGIDYYLAVSDETTRLGTRIYYCVEWSELFSLSHRNTGYILLFVAVSLAVTGALYLITLHMLDKEVGIIRDGLDKLGQNKLDTRIRGNFRQNGLQEIADSINAMAKSLKENIDRAYTYELKQKEAEMQELQAKFNPHFLYNSLEMFCARCYQNGDDETAELITQTAAIFRGFIGSRTFIPMSEELAFSKRYLVLFKARYGDKVQVLYDFDTEVLEYGIVRNVFQPLIENYFVHGIDTNRDDNYICFHGHLGDGDTIEIIVEDNGKGMSQEECDVLNASLQEHIQSEKESYGVKNLHQRLSLFYGDDCGLTFSPNEGGGVQIRMLIKRKFN